VLLMQVQHEGFLGDAKQNMDSDKGLVSDPS